jgi:molybdopterin-synthase adenylyltransferase
MDSRNERYARQRLIPRWDQDRLAAATAVVVGVGALGNEVAKNLALLGLGRAVLCDPDTVSAANLSRTVLFDAADLGLSKVEAAAAGLARLAPDLTVSTRPTDLVRGVGMGELAEADVVFGCLDSRHARSQLLGRCALAGARLVDGGTHPWGGEVRVRVDPAEACYGCALTPGQRAEQDAPVGCDGGGAPGPLPASIMSTSLVAAWMTMAAVRLILGEPLGWRFLDIDGATGLTRPVDVERDPTCPQHRPMGLIHKTNVDNGATVGQLLSVLPADSEPLTWTLFPLPGVCCHCSGTYNAGYTYREGTIACPMCGGRVRLRFSQHMGDAGLDIRLCDLGVAPEEILAVRLPEGEYQWLRLRQGGAAAGTTSRGDGYPTLS